MATFEQRVQRIVDQKYSEELDLFQTGTDRTRDLLDLLEELMRTIPLVQDIKTEVAAIQKMLSNQPADDDSNDDDQRGPTNQDDEVIKFIEDLGEKILNIEQFNDLLRLAPNTGVPLLPGDGSNGNGMGPKFLKLFFYVWKTIRDLKKAINKEVADQLANFRVKEILNTLSAVHYQVVNSEKLVKEKAEEISVSLSECCSDLHTALENCCESMGLKLDNIERKINDLNPDADANKDLALQSRARAILAEVQTVRGLL